MGLSQRLRLATRPGSDRQAARVSPIAIPPVNTVVITLMMMDRSPRPASVARPVLHLSAQRLGNDWRGNKHPDRHPAADISGQMVARTLRKIQPVI